MQPSAYLFDLDGTLLDTLADLAQSINQVRVSYALEPWSHEQVRAAIGHGLPSLLRRALKATGREWTEALLAESRERFRAHYLTQLCVETRPYPGVEKALAQLRARGLRLAVVSNKDEYFCTLLAQHYFPGQFDAVLGGDSVAAKKPAPDMLLEAARRLGCPIESCVMVGDSPGDLEAAARAGCAEKIAVTWGFRDEVQLRPQADRLLSHIDQLLDDPDHPASS